jgi:hypothetical protein
MGLGEVDPLPFSASSMANPMNFSSRIFKPNLTPLIPLSTNVERGTNRGRGKKYPGFYSGVRYIFTKRALMLAGIYDLLSSGL